MPDELGPHTLAAIEELTALRVELQAQYGRRLWAAIMLTPHLSVCRSILLGEPVLARQLEALALRRAYRGADPIDPTEYIIVTPDMLDTINEAGPFEGRGIVEILAALENGDYLSQGQ